MPEALRVDRHDDGDSDAGALAVGRTQPEGLAHGGGLAVLAAAALAAQRDRVVLDDPEGRGQHGALGQLCAHAADERQGVAHRAARGPHRVGGGGHAGTGGRDDDLDQWRGARGGRRAQGGQHGRGEQRQREQGACPPGDGSSRSHVVHEVLVQAAGEGVALALSTPGPPGPATRTGDTDPWLACAQAHPNHRPTRATEPTRTTEPTWSELCPKPCASTATTTASSC